MQEGNTQASFFPPPRVLAGSGHPSIVTACENRARSVISPSPRRGAASFPRSHRALSWQPGVATTTAPPRQPTPGARGPLRSPTSSAPSSISSVGSPGCAGVRATSGDPPVPLARVLGCRFLLRAASAHRMSLSQAARRYPPASPRWRGRAAITSPQAWRRAVGLGARGCAARAKGSMSRESSGETIERAKSEAGKGIVSLIFCR